MKIFPSVSLKLVFKFSSAGSFEMRVNREAGAIRMIVPVERSRRARPSSPVCTCPFASRNEFTLAGVNASCTACLISTLPVISLIMAESMDGEAVKVGVGCMVGREGAVGVLDVVDAVGAAWGVQAFNTKTSVRNIEIKALLSLIFILPPKFKIIIASIILAHAFT